MAQKILIIEDDSDLRQVLKIMLEQENYIVSQAENGLSGLKKFKNDSFDLVITDIIMPEKEGLETIFELKKINPSVKIIAISGGGRIAAEEYLLMAKNFGVSTVLSKPFKKDAFLFSVKEALGIK
ncbi:MAG: response regulator [Desulforegulaceae bacterium]|jgi:DNA-binding NtrC family response regulator|nr:response regulator [Desulforegulaceae bacterium]